MCNVKIIFASGRNLQIEALDVEWNSSTLVIKKKDESYINVSYYTVETIEIIYIE